MADIIVFLAFLESSADGIPFTRASSVLHWHIILDVDCGVVFWFWRGVWTIHLFLSRWCRKPHPKVCLVAEDVLRSFLKSTFVPLTKCPFLFPMLLLVWSFIEHPSKWLVCIIACYSLLECKPVRIVTLAVLYNSVITDPELALVDYCHCPNCSKTDTS